MVQEKNEKVPQLATKIEIKLSSMRWGFSQKFVSSVKSNTFRDSIRFQYNDPNISHSELLRFARETELEEGGAGFGSKGKMIQGPRLMLVSCSVGISPGKSRWGFQ